MEIIARKKEDKIVLQANEFMEGRQEEYRQVTLFDEDEDREIMLMNDNNKKRLFFERCQVKAKSVCNHIVDWSTRELWKYIEAEKIEVIKLYYCGFDRVGCIGCPMADKKRYFQFSVFPKYREMYLRAFKKMLEVMKQGKGKPPKWKDEVEVFDWWMENREIDGQMDIEDYLTEY